MACWQDEAIPLLRIIINDMDEANYEFSDNRLITTLLGAARYVEQEMMFDNDYVVSFGSQVITPDPADEGDDAFINFMVLKAACMIDIGNARVAAMTAGLEAKCGPAVMKTLKQMEGFGTLLSQGSCATYEQLKKEYVFGNVEWARGILSPFSNKNFLPHLHAHGGGGHYSNIDHRQGY